jgi:hypothetical protein
MMVPRHQSLGCVVMAINTINSDDDDELFEVTTSTITYHITGFLKPKYNIHLTCMLRHLLFQA